MLWRPFRIIDHAERMIRKCDSGKYWRGIQGWLCGGINRPKVQQTIKALDTKTLPMEFIPRETPELID